MPALGPQYQIYDPATIALSRLPLAGNIIPASTLFGKVNSTVSGQQRVIYVGARLMW